VLDNKFAIFWLFAELPNEFYQVEFFSLSNLCLQMTNSCTPTSPVPSFAEGKSFFSDIVAAIVNARSTAGRSRTRRRPLRTHLNLIRNYRPSAIAVTHQARNIQISKCILPNERAPTVRLQCASFPIILAQDIYG
jgi:hypothetical protein